MTRTSDDNPTGVRGYDHTDLAHMAEYVALQQALDQLAHAIGRAGHLQLGQDAFLDAVQDVAAAVGYADSCPRCREAVDQIPGRDLREFVERHSKALDPVYPYSVDVRDGRVVGWYRCPEGHTWSCEYSIDAPGLFGGFG